MKMTKSLSYIKYPNSGLGAFLDISAPPPPTPCAYDLELRLLDFEFCRASPLASNPPTSQHRTIGSGTESHDNHQHQSQVCDQSPDTTLHQKLAGVSNYDLGKSPKEAVKMKFAKDDAHYSPRFLFPCQQRRWILSRIKKYNIPVERYRNI